MQTTLVTAVGVNTFVVNSTLDGIDASTADNICQTATVGQCTLRAAIMQANATANVGGPDVIAFNISPGGPAPILVGAGGLPTITTQPVVIDGTTQPGFVGSPLIVLNGIGAGAGANGITITSFNNTIRGLVINSFAGNGVLITGAGATGNLLQGNYIGTNVASTIALPNAVGVQLANGASGNTIGGSTAIPGTGAPCR